MKKYGKILLAYGSAFAVSLIGIVWQMLLPSPAAMIVLGVLAALPLPLLGLSVLLSKRYVHRLRHANVAQMQGYLLRHRREAETTAHTLLKKLRTKRRLTTVYAVALWLMAACGTILGGMLYFMTSSFLFFFSMYAGTIFYVVYGRIPKKEPVVLHENAPVLKKEEYPTLYSLAERAAQALGYRGKITILLSPDCNASVILDEGHCYLNLGVVFLSIAADEEFYSVCLHEFSHCKDQHRGERIERHYSAWISEAKYSSRVMSITSELFSFLDVRYLFDYMIYQYATSVVKETESDLDMAKYGDPTAAASALLKLNYDDKFQWEQWGVDETPDYAADTPPEHYLRNTVQRFAHAIEERSGVWNGILEKEILANNASHPTLKMRLQTLGVDHMELYGKPSDPSYDKEVQAALDFADAWLLKENSSYEKDREEAYFAPLRRIDEWESRGMPVVAEEFGDVIADLQRLGRQSDAERLCERAMETLDVNSSPQAYFVKGCYLLHRYDESGIELIYHAMETNHNFMEEGLEVLGQFFCITGREDDLQAYRERAREMAQKDRDEYSETSVLSKNDNLSSEHLPDGMLEDILAYIRSIDCDIIQNIYLVRKTINENFFTSAFVIHFYGGTDEMRDDIMHKIFRYLDTYPVDWQFSLFDYFECMQIKFDRIEGSLVFSKNQQTQTKGENR